ncbi:SnoaL-like polyketide cyclase [Chitinophaga terrae (ex Kim and Jung 2007)]|uniref:SnoaL-like polyketide cyclase n=1 Tax=Chitinophaga terrae (ex Kim and Jung 2007) TaxID=408074 RepID=A0A1H4FHA0_9BACT|nr:ester cyclase [Chitinophaga terrae (ex Kim and Jung 2007)]GEP92522.1 hypothetical protein CTE07_41670 [Chitinophaga terrae (ex Kim and Jung 2007)]SEA96763.1 SnoaL-like polyketide cyclase [Chitinophaga terrae (ex Kim and Jung 2007)]
MQNSTIINTFIEQVWNREQFQLLPDLLHPAFKDYSLPATFPPGQDGLQKWITTTSHSFKHHTQVEELVCEGNNCIAKITMHCRHIGPWRNIAATGKEVSTSGYRHFKLEDGRIIAHWALIDGQTLENELLGTSHGCQRAR